MSEFKFNVTQEGNNEWLEIPAIKGQDIIEFPVRRNQEDWNARSAISAYGKFFKLGFYDHPKTDVHIHFNAGMDIPELFFEPEIGYVSMQYRGDMFYEADLDPDVYTEGWAAFSRRNGKYYLHQIKEAKRIPTCRLHDFVTAALKGKGLKVRVSALNINKDPNGFGWWDKVLLNWQEPDREKAVEMYWNNVNAASEKKEVGKKAYNLRQSGNPVLTQRGAESGAVIIVTREGEMVNLSNMEQVDLIGIDRRGARHSFFWGVNETQDSKIAVAADRGYTFILPGQE